MKRSSRAVPKKDYLANLDRDIHATGLPTPEREVRFHPTRMWRFDRAWRAWKVAIEYDGGIFTGEASHSSAKGIMRDQEKLNEAQLLGWIVIRCCAATVRTGRAVSWAARAITSRQEPVNDFDRVVKPAPPSFINRDTPPLRHPAPVRRRVLG